MDPTSIIALAEALAKIGGVIAADIQAAHATHDATTLAQVKAILDPLHDQNMALSAALDAKLAAIEAAG